MSKKILTDIDLGGNEVKKSRVENLSTNPTDALKAGRVWQNTSDKEMYYYDGSKIKKLSGAAGSSIKEQVLISADTILTNEHNGKQMIVVTHMQLGDYTEVISDTTSSQSYTAPVYLGSSYTFDSSTGMYTVAQTTKCAKSSTGASNAAGKYFIELSESSTTLTGTTMYHVESATYASNTGVTMVVTPYTSEQQMVDGDTSVSLSENAAFSDYAEIELYSKNGTINLTIPESITVITNDGAISGGSFEVLQGDNKTLKCLTAADSTNKTWGLYGGFDNMKTEYYTVNISGDVAQYASSISPVTIDGTVYSEESTLTVKDGTVAKVQVHKGGSTSYSCSVNYNGVTVVESTSSNAVQTYEYEFTISNNTTINFVYTQSGSGTSRIYNYICNITTS